MGNLADTGPISDRRQEFGSPCNCAHNEARCDDKNKSPFRRARSVHTIHAAVCVRDSALPFSQACLGCVVLLTECGYNLSLKFRFLIRGRRVDQSLYTGSDLESAMIEGPHTSAQERLANMLVRMSQIDLSSSANTLTRSKS